ncbi:hypothetical protein [Algoriphagus sp.]|uniref:hypothetical protein n=1 Tax=Algoriphagus sp. TaxID=1872435 RepID=UPI0026167F53|nr:hypothetical protein [Algoriphagus sp.]
MKDFLIKFRDKLFGIDKISYFIESETSKKIILGDFNKRELKAFEILKPYFPEGFLLETSYSLSFQTIQHIINDIVIYKPKIIFEFGSGLSTMILGNFIQKNHLETRLISIDDDSSWQELLKNQGAKADFYCFPLAENHPFSFEGKGKWYNIPDNHPITELKFDLVLVDAPKGDLSKLSRYGFVGFMINKLSDQVIVYLDDTHRTDEHLIAQFFLKEIGVPMVQERFYKYSRFSSSNSFNTSPS